MNETAKPFRWRDWFPEPRAYGVVLVLFVGALLSKTVTATLPAALLVILAWKRGRFNWRDVVPLLPMFVVGMVMGLLTASLEQSRVGASGPDWTYASSRGGELVARTLIAGRALWFYAGKILLPIDLAFIYTRWKIDVSAAWQYAFPAAAAMIVAIAFLLRRRIGNGPLVALLLFGGTLFPALGYFNVYPHRFSFVADHFQYLASISLIALVCSALAINAPCVVKSVMLRRTAAGVLLVVLAALTFRQGFIYKDPETLWRDALAKTEGSWMVYTNLGRALADQGKYDDAIPFFTEANRIAPQLHDTWWNVGVGRARQGDIDGAEQAFRKSMELNANFAPAYEGLGKLMYFRRKDPVAAEALFRKGLEIAPTFAELNFAYGAMLFDAGRYDEAASHLRDATLERLNFLEAHEYLASALLRLRHVDEALYHLNRVTQIDPQKASAWRDLGKVLLAVGQRDTGVNALRKSFALEPRDPETRFLMQRAGISPN